MKISLGLDDSVKVGKIGAPSGGLPTKTIGQVATGLTWWGKNDPNYLYTDAGVTKVSAIGQAVYRMAPLHGALNFDQSDSALRPTYQAAGVYFDDTDTLAGGTLANHFAAGAKTVIMALQVNTGWLNADYPFGSDSGYWAVQLATGNLVQHYNYDGSSDVTPGVSFVNGVPFVFAAWHNGTTLSIAVNNGTVSSIASGNTAGTFAQTVRLAARGANYTPMYFKEGGTWNVALAQADREQIVSGLMQNYGIS